MLAIIGGTGIYKLDELDVVDKISVDTPFGKTSAPIVKAKYKDKDVLFLPRHGENHQYLPHEINYRANIFALKKLGARQVVGFSAVGSLSENIHPEEFTIHNQYFDWIKGNRERTFFGEGIAAHISNAEHTCENLTKWIADKALKIGMKIHTEKTYACVDGPRLGTKAESNFLRLAGCDLVGMTNVPEVFLAREAQLCYATVGIVTDYDCWMDDVSKHVSVAGVMRRYGKSLEKAKKLLLTLLDSPLPRIDNDYRMSLKDAILTSADSIPEGKKNMLEVLQN